MNIGDLTNNNDNKVHARKGKSLIEFNAKKIFFKPYRKFEIYFLLSESVFCPLQFKPYGMVAHQPAVIRPSF